MAKPKKKSVADEMLGKIEEVAKSVKAKDKSDKQTFKSKSKDTMKKVLSKDNPQAHTLEKFSGVAFRFIEREQGLDDLKNSIGKAILLASGGVTSELTIKVKPMGGIGIGMALGGKAEGELDDEELAKFLAAAAMKEFENDSKAFLDFLAEDD